jgi:hypothetical protein
VLLLCCQSEGCCSSTQTWDTTVQGQAGPRSDLHHSPKSDAQYRKNCYKSPCELVTLCTEAPVPHTAGAAFAAADVRCAAAQLQHLRCYCSSGARNRLKDRFGLLFSQSICGSFVWATRHGTFLLSSCCVPIMQLSPQIGLKVIPLLLRLRRYFKNSCRAVRVDQVRSLSGWFDWLCSNTVTEPETDQKCEK